MKRFYAIEYVDDEGDPVIGHAWMTETEAGEALVRLARDGFRPKAYDLTPQTVGSVTSPDGRKKLASAS